MVRVFEAPLQNRNNSFFCIVQFRQPHPRHPRQTSLLVFEVHWCGCFGRPTRTQTMVFSNVQFKPPQPRCPKTPLMAYGVQWHGWLGRHPRNQRIFIGIVQPPPSPGVQKHLCSPMRYSGMAFTVATSPVGAVQNPHPRYPQTLLLAYGVHR